MGERIQTSDIIFMMCCSQQPIELLIGNTYNIIYIRGTFFYLFIIELNGQTIPKLIKL